MIDPVKPQGPRGPGSKPPGAAAPASPPVAPPASPPASPPTPAAALPMAAIKLPDTALAAAAGAGGAGALLRSARQLQGLHIAALAASIKVSPAKLESLEAGRYQDLLDITFARSLAQAMCRALKLDPLPVLALMPGVPSDALGPVDGGLRAPYRDRLGRSMPGDWAPWRHPVLWLVALLLLAAAAFVLVPAGALRDPLATGSSGAGATVMPPALGASAGAALDPAPTLGAGLPAVPADAAASNLPGSSVPTSSPSSTPPSAQSSTSPSPLAAATRSADAAPSATADTVLLRAVQASWVQAIDARGQVLMARTIPAGETVELTPAFPLRLRIGNAAGVELLHRGQTINLKAMTRDNTVNISLP